MKIIEPSVEYWQQGAGMEGVWHQIARATRVCYQSKPKEGESSEDFVKRIILKPALIEGNLDDLEHCKFNFDKMHGAMLEHGTVYITVPPYIADDKISAKAFTILIINKYSKVNTINNWDYITTNLRVLFEENILDCLKYITEPTEHHVKRYTFSVITDIGVTREMNRHRASMSIAEESTRYCCYNSNKFGNELTYVKPAWESKDKPLIVGPFTEFRSDEALFHELLTEIKHGFNAQWTAKTYYIFGLLASEFAYMGMRSNGEVVDKCRQVLNLNTKTQAVYTAFSDDWEHFLRLRADNVSGKAHPNIQLVAKKIKDIIETL